MIWQVICICGLKSEFFGVPGTMSSEMYLKEDQEKRLLPLIRKDKSKTLFWPDLTRIHYAEKVLE